MTTKKTAGIARWRRIWEAVELLKGGIPRRLLMRTILPALLAAVSVAVTDVRAQQLPVAGEATDFNSVEYYRPPHQQDIRDLFSGAEADPLPGGLLLLKRVKIEAFDRNGKLQYVVEAPECVYDPVNFVANSPGEIHVQSGDGRMKIDGQGFSWQKNQSLFTISNQVETVIVPPSKR